MTVLGPQTEIAGYTILEILGRGGMSVVYRARDERLGRDVALKVLAPELADDLGFSERFEREARLIATTEHPNIVPIYDTGLRDGVLYLAMRYVAGRSLHGLVERDGPLEPAAAAGIVAAVAGALDAAHARGLVHRDVKPQNVLIEDGSGHVYLADFGLAKPATSRALTKTGIFVGTLDYVPPEQIQGSAVDARTDVYALGAVLYFALTGRVPYERDSDVAVLHAHLIEPPPRPTEARPGLPVAFDDVVVRAMAKRPDERYASAAEVARAALDAVRSPRAEPSPPPAAAPAAPAAPVPEPTFVPPPPVGPPTVVVELPTPAAPPPVAVERPESRPGARRRLLDRLRGARGSRRRPAAPPPPPPAPATSPPPSAVSGNGAATLRLREGFRYVHEPLATEQDALPFLGNQHVVDALRERIEHSTGGSFLITGFRGVGKTTVIKRALEELCAESSGARHVVPVSLNVARPITTDELLFEVVRRLFEALTDRGILGRLHPDTQRALIVAYTRTSLSFKETRAQAQDRSRSLELGLGAVAAPVLGRLTPKLAFSKSETRSLATEASFLAYSDADVEHDFLRIVSLVQRTEALVPRRRRLALRTPMRETPWMGQLIVVIDELDKLTESEDGLACVEQILTGLKNLLTTHGVHFLFVAGTDLHDRALQESHRGNSVYESVFGWQVYVPCVWDAPSRLLDALVHPDDRHDRWFRALEDYLTFKARGIPRLLLIELNSLVVWREGRPVLSLKGLDAARVEFYAALQRLLAEFLGSEGDGASPFTIPIDEDRWRLGAYYVTDWILRSRGTTFTVDDIVGAKRAGPAERTGARRGGPARRQPERVVAVDPTLVISTRKVEGLVEHLARHGILEQVRGLADHAVVSDVPDASKAAYRVVTDVGQWLASFQHGRERERVELGAERNGDALGAQPWADSTTFGLVSGGRYELLRELDRGGLASVYHARDRVLGRDVAVKMLEHPSLAGDPRVRARFQRHGQIAGSLEHRNIVRTYDTFEEEDGRRGIVMQFLDGISLRELLAWAPMPAPEAVRLALELCDALAYLGERGIARLDLKPSNVILDGERRPVIIDLGLAKVVHGGGAQPDVTIVGALVGTPAYVAPEQIDGGEVDIRTDLYTLGLLLYEMLAGRPARRGAEIAAVIDQARSEDVDVSELRASAELRDALARALSRRPEERFQQPSEMQAALRRTPEAAGAEAP